MGKSINNRLSKDDTALLLTCCEIYHHSTTGNPVPLLNLMRQSKSAVLKQHSEYKFQESLGAVGKAIRADFMGVGRRKSQQELYEGVVAAIKEGQPLSSIYQVCFMRDATDLYMRAWLGQYDKVTDCINSMLFDSLTYGDLWERLRDVRMDGLGINNPAVPDSARVAREFNQAYTDLFRKLQSSEQSSSQSLE